MGSLLLPFPRPEPKAFHSRPSQVRIMHHGPSLTGGHGPRVNSSHTLMVGLMTSAVSPFHSLQERAATPKGNRYESRNISRSKRVAPGQVIYPMICSLVSAPMKTAS